MKGRDVVIGKGLLVRRVSQAEQRDFGQPLSTPGNLFLFDLSKDIAEQKDLRTKLPKVYASLKTELIDHLANVNSKYPGGGSPAAAPKEEPKPRKTKSSPSPNRPTIDQFFKSRDRNQDGAITLEEFIGNPKDRNVLALTKRFKNLDANGDGKLQPDELKR